MKIVGVSHSELENKFQSFSKKLKKIEIPEKLEVGKKW
jgi:hypothetical protein